MRCQDCDRTAVFSGPAYCKEHFNSYFESKVDDTLARFGMAGEGDRILVAVSGGKDSLVLLRVLSRKFPNVEALSVDEGIAGYREVTHEVLRSFCQEWGITLRIVGFKEEFGKTLDVILSEKQVKPCTVCGIFRRTLLNRHSQGYDVIATGHNMDDTAQAIMMNLLKNSPSLLARQGPVSGIRSVAGLTKRIKPLYYCSEKEVMAYSILNGIVTKFIECPNVSEAYRLKVRDQLNRIEASRPGTKRRIVDWFIGISGRLKESEGKDAGRIGSCSVCGEPSANAVCSSCKMQEFISSP
jgi:tRNA-5-methyluridine54 2-sulfurtransferase